MDLENLAQLSQYILQHLRESLLVLDAEDRVRLINDSAAALLGQSLAVRGALLGEVSHGAQVELNFQLPETQAPALKARLDEAGQGRVGWLAPA